MRSVPPANGRHRPGSLRERFERVGEVRGRAQIELREE